MYIIIVGGGNVGYYLAKALLDEGHEVLVMEKSAEETEFICSQLGSVCMRGDGCEVTTMADAGASRADMLIAVTGDDDDNLVACQVAKHKHNVPRTIARIRNPQNAELFKKLGVDVTVSTTDLILETIEREVPTHPLTHLLTLDEQNLVMIDVKISLDSTLIGKAVKDLSLPKESKLVLIIPEEGSPQVPTDSTELRANDQIIAVTPLETEDAFKAALRGT